MRFRFYTLLFGIAIFILTAVGLGIVYYRTLILPSLWLGFIYVVVWVLVFIFAANFFVKDDKLSWKQFLFLTFVAIIISGTITHSAWIIVTPRWAFSVSTDKSTYSLGENITITAYLRNTGFITHSFKSALSNPVYIYIRHRARGYQVWYSPYNLEDTVFSLEPNQLLQRIFLWNQTNIHQPEKEIEPGEYTILAEIPYTPLWTSTHINIIST